MTDSTLTAPDGTALGVSWFQPEQPVAAVLIASAMGVPRRFYKHFASHLADAGLAVLTLDYRGIGTSKGHPDADLFAWADQDLATALAALTTRYPTLPVRYVGHSVGGQLLGLLDTGPIDGALLIASQSGFWGHWNGLARLRMLALWYGVIPLGVPMLGRLPGAVFGGGDDIPYGVALQWARWGRHPLYIGSVSRETPGFTGFTGRLRAIAVSDDTFAPRAAVEALVALYTRADTEVVTVRPAQLDLEAIGHFGAFRPSMAERWWPELARWLTAPGGG